MFCFVFRSVSILLIGAVILGIIIGLGLKDAKLIRAAAAEEAPTRASDFQNIFVNRDISHSSNMSDPLVLKKTNITRTKRLFGRSTSRRINTTKSTSTYNFELAKTMANQLRVEIHQRWQIDAFPEFKKTMHIPKDEWETYKNKFEYLLDHPNSTKTFTIAFGGSSVTAGHDNFITEAYPSLVREQLTPIFRLLGVKLTVNIK
jgi:hypothetical protein